MAQKESETRNKQCLEHLVSIKDEFVGYYYTHTNKETCNHYNINGNRVLMRALVLCNYDANYKKTHNVMKGRKSLRSHESYVLGGKKSSNTQKKNWENKTKEEKEAWKGVMVESHNNDDFKTKISAINKEYWKSLPEEKKICLSKKRSDSSKKWWSSLTESAKNQQIKDNLEHGAGWNHDKIFQTVQKRYGVSNVAKIESVKKKSLETLSKTCREKYGIMWPCQLPQCNNAIGSKGMHTKPNDSFASLLSSHGLAFEREYVIAKTKYRYDFKVGDTLVEIDPTPWHNSTFSPTGAIRGKEYHANKSKTAFDNGFHCIHLFDWDDKNKAIYLLRDTQSIGARKCLLKEVSKQDAIDFINKHHMQDYARDKVRLGLYLGDELVSIMTFGKPRYNRNYEWEIIRYCSSKKIIGGAQKLFTHFIKSYNPSSIITYCDKSKFSGGTYERLGFSLLRSGSPSKHWYNMQTGEHYTDNLIRQQGFSRVVNHRDAKDDDLPTSDNNELMVEHGFVEVWDCGQDTYVWKAQ